MSSRTGSVAIPAAYAPEPIILPDLPVVDAHFHLWNLMGFDYFAPDFLQDVEAGHKVEASVYVECDMGYSDHPDPDFRPVGEVFHVLRQIELARDAEHRLAAGIIGSANLMLAEKVAPVLEAQIEAGKGRVRGIRTRIAWDPDPVAGYGGRTDFPQENIVRTQAFLDGAKRVERLGLILETFGFHTQLADLRRVAVQCPDLTIVLNHLGGPLGVGRYAERQDDVFRDWSAGLRAIAELPNVFIKLSGVGVTRLGLGFGGKGQAASSDAIASAAASRIRTCLDTFGAGRCIFGSNYPVDKVVSSYPVLLNGYKKMLGDLSRDECEAIFSGNARRVYRLS
ncbi:Predicted metal-dependent hydrolase, TIM-barrel fold [Azospirillum oryzae]|uniref:Predicted metal-dependent hydrolase, TIM-barrel fold n=1 Tax=Azospirillum oryzae TaxID=286727 RepID=A0A1X7HP70_9PROT|nr:amidohydrolase family protein [Azospirillum oryzae]SMF90139.1 Predicted metal-dependent hydrolase, TIM-barrel fold [Azospirillum oryzae]